MQQMVDKLIKQYGTDLVIRRGEEEMTVRGFFRAVSTKDVRSVEWAVTPLGAQSRGKYTYIGPAESPVYEGDILAIDGKQYQFRRTEGYYCGDRVLYYWGLCIEKGGSEAWGQQS